MRKQKWYVYFLLNDKKVVYVGMSCRMQSRLFSHLKDKKFNSIRWIGCRTKATAAKYERRWILKLMPEHNNDILLKIRRREKGLVKKHLSPFAIELLKNIEEETGVPYDELLKQPLVQSLYEYEK
jgi:predicted GIY-YIG superfamily endonuclease